jgi:hypothetical protein
MSRVHRSMSFKNASQSQGVTTTTGVTGMRLLGRDPQGGAQTHHGQSRQCLSRSLSAVEDPCRQFVGQSLFCHSAV